MSTTDLDTVRQLIMLVTGDEKHSPSAYSTLDLLWVLYDRVLRYDPVDPRSEERDRFVMSKGHGPVAYYAVLASRGFFPTEELRRFEQWEGILGAHPDHTKVPGVEASTGSLGHGLSIGVGMALALQAKRSDRRVFVLVGDGECNEGSIWEAAMVAANQHLTGLTCIVVNNHSSIIQVGDLAEKFAAFGWASTKIDGRNHEQIYTALTDQDSLRPRAIIADIQKA